MPFERLQSLVTPIKRYGVPLKTSTPKIVPYDGSPLNLFFRKHNVPRGRIQQVLTDSEIGNALNIKKGTPIIIYDAK